MKAIFSVFDKEMRDALRDRRTMLVALISAVFGVPMMLFIFSSVLTQSESQERKRVVVAHGMAAAPTLENFILRQGFTIDPAPADYIRRSQSKELEQPVLLVPEAFDTRLAAGEMVTLEIAYDTSNRQAEFGVRPLRRLLEAFVQERVSMGLMMRGVSLEMLEPIEIRERYLQKSEERKATLTAMLPMMLLMAVVLGGMYAAIDSTAGERERGSLEPLMMNPISSWQLTVGKWAAVAVVGMAVVSLTIFSFFPSQWLIHNETLRAEFQFGWKDAWQFLLVLLPLSAMMAAVQIAVSLDCKSYKEGQARNQMVTMFVPFAGLIPMLYTGRDPVWFAWVPVLAQNQLMNQLLKGETLAWTALWGATLPCLALGAGCLLYVSRRLRNVL